ncbi:MAG: hypothetical protein R2818_10655 [Flavobacteriales bacterium]
MYRWEFHLTVFDAKDNRFHWTAANTGVTRNPGWTCAYGRNVPLVNSTAKENPLLRQALRRIDLRTAVQRPHRP